MVNDRNSFVAAFHKCGGGSLMLANNADPKVSISRECNGDIIKFICENSRLASHKLIGMVQKLRF